jgi:hypothetical protein
MNPDHFGRTDELILSTLAHEMAHRMAADPWPSAAPLLP